MSSSEGEKPPFWPPPPGWKPGTNAEPTTAEAQPIDETTTAVRVEAGEPGSGQPSEQHADGVLEVRGHNGTVRLDSDFVTIIRKGLLARGSIGKGEKRIPISSITAVQFKPAGPVVNGFIQFTLGGGNEAKSRFGHQTSSAARDENSVIFHRRQSTQFAELRDAVETAIAARHRAHAHPPPATPESIPDQIGKLAALRDSGILTEEEFQQKKSDLLAKM